MKKQILTKMKGKGGITLIALVITIIVLLILAGVAISTLTGENGILTQAQKVKTQTVYAEAQERMRLAYMAVRAEIGAQAVEDVTYNATEHVDELVALVEDDLEENEWTVTGGTETITMRYENSDLVKDSIAEGKPTNNGYVEGVITLGAQTATFVFDGEVTLPPTEGEEGSGSDSGSSSGSSSISSIVLADDYGHSYTVEEGGKYYFYSYTWGQNFMSVFNVTQVDGTLQANKLGEYAMETGRTRQEVLDGETFRDNTGNNIFNNATLLGTLDYCVTTKEVFLGDTSYKWHPKGAVAYLLEPGFYYAITGEDTCGGGYYKTTYIVNTQFEIIEYEEYVKDLKDMSNYDLNQSGTETDYRGWVNLQELAIDWYVT